MKIYLKETGFVMAGKAWEIRAVLQRYARKYEYVNDWIYAVRPAEVIPFPHTDSCAKIKKKEEKGMKEKDEEKAPRDVTAIRQRTGIWHDVARPE